MPRSSLNPPASIGLAGSIGRSPVRPTALSCKPFGHKTIAARSGTDCSAMSASTSRALGSREHQSSRADTPIISRVNSFNTDLFSKPRQQAWDSPEVVDLRKVANNALRTWTANDVSRLEELVGPLQDTSGGLRQQAVSETSQLQNCRTAIFEEGRLNNL